MSNNTATLKASVNFPALVAETHPPDQKQRILCLAHDDTNPSCVVYPDHVFCFSCGWHTDAIGWLMLIYGLSFAEAVKALEQRAQGYVSPSTGPRLSRQCGGKPKRTALKPLPADVLMRHRLAAQRLSCLPAVLLNRGLDLEDAYALGVAAIDDDAVLPLYSPAGRVLALKRRHAIPNPNRYTYLTKGCGSPAWCSPGFLEAADVLIIEGELNGMACWLARPDLAVIGVAGANGALYLEVLEGRVVYIYADGDEPGQKARDRWAAEALDAGANKVLVVDPWPDGDACDLAGMQGRGALRDALTHSLTNAKPVQRSITRANPVARFFADGNGVKPDLCKRATSVWDRAHWRLP